MLIGIDYSMNCPAVCYLEGEQMHFRFLTDTKKYNNIWKGKNFIIEGIEHFNWKHPIERYTNIVHQLLGDTDYEIKKLRNAKNINIEDYSMGSKGLIFNIAENVAILKNFLWERDVEYNTVPPTVVKKFATGKGNSKKEQMYEAWLYQVGIDLKKIMDIESNKVTSPLSDLVDAYFLAKLDKWHK
jgi:Holliday junction resolvasome RuvABC endonuclease subunit